MITAVLCCYAALTALSIVMLFSKDKKLEGGDVFAAIIGTLLMVATVFAIGKANQS